MKNVGVVYLDTSRKIRYQAAVKLCDDIGRLDRSIRANRQESVTREIIIGINLLISSYFDERFLILADWSKLCSGELQVVGTYARHVKDSFDPMTSEPCFCVIGVK